MSRTPIFLVFLLAGCAVPPERDAALKPLPEGAFSYSDVLARARIQAGAALEAFYADDWAELTVAADRLAESANILPRTSEIPPLLKARLGKETDQLRHDATRLGEAARTKDAPAVNESLRRINQRIRELRAAEQ